MHACVFAQPHHSSGRSGALGTLRAFEACLQMSRRVKVFALLSGAAALHVVHAHCHCVISAVNHGAVTRVGKPTVCLSSGAVPPLKLSTHLHIQHQPTTKIATLRSDAM